MKKEIKSTVTACLAALAIITNSCGIVPLQVSSLTENEQAIEDLEAEKEINNMKIQILQEEIKQAQAQFASIEADENAKLEYKNALNKKIALQNENIDYVAEQISMIDAKIAGNVYEIGELDKKIAKNEEDIEESTKILKKRVRASYMTGEDNISAILTGSTSFYDILAKFKMVSKITEHDNELIDKLDNQLKELSELKDSLHQEREILNANLDDETKRKAEFTEALDQLSADYTETQKELMKLGDDKAVIVEDIEAKEEAMEQQENELKKIADQMEIIEELIRQEAIQESIRVSESVSVSVEESRKAEEARKAEESRRAEEERKAEESRKAAEEERKKAEAEAGVKPPAIEETPVTQPPVTEAPPEPVTVPPVQQAPPQVSSRGFMWPVPGYGRIGSGYGPRSLDNHKGIDINASDGGTILGHEIVAAASGYVAIAENSCSHNYGKSYSCGCGGGYGRYVVIRHDDGSYATLYGHMSSVVVSPMQHVSQGQTIGYAGTTGYSFGPHLHFEVHKLPFSYDRSNTLDPEDFVNAPY